MEEGRNSPTFYDAFKRNKELLDNILRAFSVPSIISARVIDILEPFVIWGIKEGLIDNNRVENLIESFSKDRPFRMGLTRKRRFIESLKNAWLTKDKK